MTIDLELTYYFQLAYQHRKRLFSSLPARAHLIDFKGKVASHSIQSIVVEIDSATAQILSDYQSLTQGAKLLQMKGPVTMDNWANRPSEVELDDQWERGILPAAVKSFMVTGSSTPDVWFLIISYDELQGFGFGGYSTDQFRIF